MEYFKSISAVLRQLFDQWTSAGCTILICQFHGYAQSTRLKSFYGRISITAYNLLSSQSNGTTFMRKFFYKSICCYFLFSYFHSFKINEVIAFNFDVTFLQNVINSGCVIVNKYVFWWRKKKPSHKWCCCLLRFNNLMYRSRFECLTFIDDTFLEIRKIRALFSEKNTLFFGWWLEMSRKWLKKKRFTTLKSFMKWCHSA